MPSPDQALIGNAMEGFVAFELLHGPDDGVKSGRPSKRPMVRGESTHRDGLSALEQHVIRLLGGR